MIEQLAQSFFNASPFVDGHESLPLPQSNDTKSTPDHIDVSVHVPVVDTLRRRSRSIWPPF